MKSKLVSVFVSLGLGMLGTFSFTKIANSQTSVEYLRPGQTTSFQASRPSGQWNYTQWRSCFNSSSRSSRNAFINVYSVGASSSYNYSTSTKNCVTYPATGHTWVIKNTGNTSISIEIIPSYR